MSSYFTIAIITVHFLEISKMIFNPKISEKMIVIGDSLIKDLRSDSYAVNCYPGMTLEEYLKNYNDLQENEDLIIYSFGTNDYNGFNFKEILDMYMKLKRGKHFTYFILPPYLNYDNIEECEMLFEDNMIAISDFIDDFNTDIHLDYNEINSTKVKFYPDIASLSNSIEKFMLFMSSNF